MGSAFTSSAFGSATPSGSDTQVQYNNNGAFGASANFTYNADNDLVLAAGAIGIQGEFDGFAAGSGLAFDWNAGTSKIVCLGTDASTVGTFKIDIAESDLGSLISPFEVNNTGQTISLKAHIVKGTLDGSMATAQFAAIDYSVSGGRFISTGTATAIGTYQIVARSTDGDPVTITTLDMATNSNATFAGTVTQNSDLKLKEDIEDLEDMTETVKALRPVQFKRKFQPNDDSHTSAKYFGFIAQEAEAHLPDLIHKNPDIEFDGTPTGEETLSFSYTEMIPILTKTIQELEARITELEG